MGIKPVLNIVCDACGHVDTIPLMRVKHTEYLLWSSPNEEELSKILREKGYMFSASDNGIHCSLCVSVSQIDQSMTH